jgi:hypothetical protein
VQQPAHIYQLHQQPAHRVCGQERRAWRCIFITAVNSLHMHLGTFWLYTAVTDCSVIKLANLCHGVLQPVSCQMLSDAGLGVDHE